MAAVSRAAVKDMYSWWWDSHISPKNSKWLQENLTDMDSKIRIMIELIEVDEDSFARRAEMYYKKRPELMTLVEEFYRAYRALAERYDHATGVIRQAHEAFPNQLPLSLTDDRPVNVSQSSDPHTPEIQPPVRASFDPDELDMGEMGLSSADFLLVKSNGDFTKGPKLLNGSGKARKGLNFYEAEKKTQVLSGSERLEKSEIDIQALKEALVKLEAEKEAGLSQYHQTIERLSKLETEVTRAKQDSGKAEAQVQNLKETLAKVEAEREASLLQYQQFHERAFKAEKETELLNEELTLIKADKDALLSKYLEALEKIANLENKLLLAEDYASQTSDRAVRAEKEVEILTETVTRLTVENEAVVLKYEECMEKIAVLGHESTLIHEENKKLKTEVGIQSQELSEKQKEMGRLWTSIQEERMRFMEVETSFESLQILHSKVQEELRSVANELQKKVHFLKEVEIENLHLADEVQKVKDENKGLNDLNLLSGVSIKNMQEEISELKDGKEKVEQEIELHLDNRNALQKQIYSLKEELNSLNQKHQDVLVKIESVGFDPESFCSSVAELKDEKSKLNVEMDALVEKLALMEKLLEKNEFLENSLSDLKAELERTREKMEALEESLEALRGEKTTLFSQLQSTTQNLENFSERNTFLESSLCDTNAELEMLRVKSKNLEHSCSLLNDQNSVLILEKQTSASQMEHIGKRHADLEKRYSGLEAERESTLQKVEELQFCLDIEKQEHDCSRQFSQIQMADMENQIRALQEMGDYMRDEFEEELDKAINAQFEIFILRNSIQDLKTENTSLLVYCEKLMEASHLSEKLVLELERTSNEQKEEVKVALSQIRGLRSGMFQLLDALETDVGLPVDGFEHEDQKILNHILGKFGDIKGLFSQLLNESEELVIEKSVLVAILREIKQDVGDLNAVIIILREEISAKNNEILVFQKDMQKLLESNEELILKVRDGNQREVVLLDEMENLREMLFSLQGACENLREENTNVLKDKEYLMKEVEDLEDEKHNLEHECSCIVGEAVSLNSFSFIFKNILSEKSMQVMELRKHTDKLCGDNLEVRNKNIYLKELLKKAENEMEEAKVVNDRLKDEITNAQDLLWLKEMKLLEAEAIKVHQENKIFELSDNYTQKMEECEKVRKENEEMQKGKDEVKLWETVGGTFFTELQSCSVREALIREKFSELMRAYETLEEESYSKGVDITQLRERVGISENENCEVKARLREELSAISSLRDSVASLEKHTIWHAKLIRTENEQKEVAEHCQNFSEDKVANLKNLQLRIQAVEKSVIELKQRAEEEYSTLRSDLDSTTRQIEVLKSQNSLRRGTSGRYSRHFLSQPQDELRMKDIILDQVSDCSSSGKNRRITGSDDLILELWETMEQGGSIDLTVGKPYRSSAVVPKSGRPSSESMVEKEVGVDEQDNSNRFMKAHQEDSKRKVLGRLASDVQKLTNLQITVQDLKEKLEMTDNYSVKDQLGETEETILKLFDYSAKLMKKIEKSSPLSFDVAPADSSDSGSARRRRCSEQARRISEKIARMQMDVQKIQCHVMKVDNSSKASSKSGGTRITERNTRILLRDYLYGVSRTPRRRKKSHFCGCVQPPTKGD